MSKSFWARQLAKDNPRPPQPPANPNAPWWHTQPPPQPAAAPASPTAAPEGPQEIVPEQVNLNRFQSTRDTDRCPGCGGTSYMTVNGADPRARHAIKRCFECGYPVTQTTSGLSNVSGGTSAPARQASSMTITDTQGRVVGHTGAATGFKGQSNYHPTDTQAGRIS